MQKLSLLRGCCAELPALELLCDRMMVRGEVQHAFVQAADADAFQRARQAGYTPARLPQPGPLDVLVGVRAESEKQVDFALGVIRSAGRIRPGAGEKGRFTSPTYALAACGEATLAVVDVRAPYAAEVARQCLQAGLGVLLCTDIPFEEEKSLRALAAEKQLPFFGSGAAGAMLCGQPLCACPPLRTGGGALLCSSFSAGLMAAFLLERGGAGVRHLLPVGRRDCFSVCGGSSTTLCLEALQQDDAVQALGLVYKAGDFELLVQLTERAAQTGIPLFVYGTGQLQSGGFSQALGFQPSLAQLAHRMSLQLGGTGLSFLTEEEAAARAARYRSALSSEQRHLRGLFLTETMCGEIAAPLLDEIGEIRSNRPVRQVHRPADLQHLSGSCVLDFGDSALSFSVRPTLQASFPRDNRLLSESYNRTIALLLADWYGAEGCGELQLRHLCSTIQKAKKTAAAEGRTLPIAVTVFAGSGSPLSPDAAKAMLEQAGAEVFFTADDAVLFARCLLARQEATA